MLSDGNKRTADSSALLLRPRGIQSGPVHLSYLLQGKERRGEMERAARTSRRAGARHEHVADELRAAIGDARFAPGARLPSERRLAREFGVSRATIVSAFNLLRGEGLIESRRGAGSWVRRRP